MRAKKNYLYYISIHLLFFAALVALTIFVMRPLQRTLRERMILLRDYIIAGGEEFFGLKIEYASMGPSLFGFLDIQGIRILETPGGPDSGDPVSSRYPLLSVSRLRVSYSFFSILKGDIPSSIRGIYLDKPLVSLNARNMEKYQTIAAKLRGDGEGAEGGNEAGDWSSFLPRTLSVRIRGGECAIRLGESSASLKGLNFDVRVSSDKINLRGKWIAGLSLSYLFDKTFAVAMAGRIAGEYDLDVHEGNITLNIPSATGEYFSIRAVNFNILLDESGLDVKKIPDHTPYDLSLNYVFASGRVSGEFRADHFSPRELMVLSGSQREYNRYLTLDTSGSASFESDGGGKIDYRVDLSGNLGQNFSLGPLMYTISGQGNEKRVRFNELSLGFPGGIPGLPRGSLHYSGDLEYAPLEPNGVVSVNNFSLSGDGLLDGELAVSSSGRRIDVFSDSFSLGEVSLSALDMEVVRGEEDLTFGISALRFRNIESWDDVSLSEISLAGTLDYNPRELQASFEFDSFSAMDILELARPFGKLPDFQPLVSGVIDNTLITTEVFITTDFTQFSYNVPRLVIAYQGKRELVALVSLSGTDRRFEISEGNIGWSTGGFNIAGAADFSNINDISFSVRASYQEQAYYLEGFMLEQNSLTVNGSYGISAYAAINPYGGYSAYFEVDSIPVPINGQFARFSIFTSMTYDNPGSWYVDLPRFEVLDLATAVSLSTSLRITGVADQDGAQFRDLYFEDGRGALWGDASFSWDQDSQTLSPRYSGNIRMATLQGGEQYNVSGTYFNRILNLTVAGEQMQLGRMLKNTQGAAVSGEAWLTWRSMNSWSVTATVNALTARNGDTDLVLSTNASITPDELAFRDLHAVYGTLEAELPALVINRPNAAAYTDARIRGTAIGRNMDMVFNARAEFAPIDSWFEISRALDSFKGLITVDRARFDTLENKDPFDLEFSRSAAGFAVSGGPENMIRAALADDGAFYTSLSYPSPIRGTVTGTLSSRTIDAQAPNLYVDLVSLWNVIPSNDIISCTGGFVNASIQIRGPLGDPEFFGFARGNSVRLIVPKYLDAEVGPVPILVTLDGNEMRFGPVIAPCGKGYGEVSGWFRFDRWIPDTLSINILAPANTPVPFSFDILGVVAAGNASGTLNIGFADRILRVTGDLTGEDTEITLNTQELSAEAALANSKNPSPVITDLVIKTGRKVEFFVLWPNTKNPILRANAAAGTGVRITSDSVSGRFSMEGDVSLRSGEIYYFQRSFYIRNGTLFFNESEIQFDPRITVRAEIRDRTDDGPVTISMIVDNAPLKSFDARFESSPPLSQVEILSLLGQNLTGESGEEGAAMNAMLASVTDVLFSQFIGVRWLERAIRDFVGLDMFSFRTQVIPNVVSRLQNPVDTNGTLGNYLDNTTVFVGKYLGPDMFFQGMLSFRYNDFLDPQGGLYRMNNDGLEVGQVILEPDLGIELHSPLFDLRWNITPLHLENLFINDTSFSLIWRFTF
jgi:hypothetical protein